MLYMSLVSSIEIEWLHYNTLKFPAIDFRIAIQTEPNIWEHDFNWL